MDILQTSDLKWSFALPNAEQERIYGIGKPLSDKHFFFYIFWCFMALFVCIPQLVLFFVSQEFPKFPRQSWHFRNPILNLTWSTWWFQGWKISTLMGYELQGASSMEHSCLDDSFFQDAVVIPIVWTEPLRWEWDNNVNINYCCCCCCSCCGWWWWWWWWNCRCSNILFIGCISGWALRGR